DLLKCRAGGLLRDVPLGTTKAVEVLLRQIDSSHGVVFRNIAKNVGELECNAKLLGKYESVGITKPENVRAAQPNGSGDPVAVPSQLIERTVAVMFEIHESAGHQIVKIFRGDRVVLYGVMKRWKDKASIKLACERAVQRMTPGLQLEALVF